MRRAYARGVTRRLLLALAVLAAAAAPALGGSLPVHVPRLTHVVVVMLENKAAGEVIGSPEAPYLNALARRGALLGSYHGVAHPSLPNYLALVSGTTGGIASDCTTCSLDARSLADTLGSGWRAYAEDLPRPGWEGGGSGDYAKKHDPFLYFRSVAASASRRDRVVPLTRLAADLAHRRLPRFALVVPNLCHDMHDCAVASGDRWLAGFLPPLLRSPALAGGAVFVVFDESDAAGNHVPALVVGPAVRPHSRFSSPTDHYGLLRTVEQALGLPLLGRSRGAQAIGGIWRS